MRRGPLGSGTYADRSWSQQGGNRSSWQNSYALGVVRVLLEAGANKDATDEDSDTVLHLACDECHLEVARLLIEAGANKEATCVDGLTPLHWAAIFWPSGCCAIAA